MPARSYQHLGAAGLGPSQGIWVAVTTFVPTFLTIFFGIPYLVRLPEASREMRDMRPARLADARAAQPTPAPIELEAAGSHRSARTGPSDDGWVRGPDFPSHGPAAHYAARMERVGFPAAVRREEGRGTRWVVWIGRPDRAP